MTRPSQVHDSNERQPLLHAKQKLETYVTVPDSHESEPGLDVYQELRTLLSLVYPVVMTMVLEFLPGFTGIILAGHIKSPFTQQYVDAATLSTMFMNITANSVGLGLASALDTLCSQAYGAQRLDPDVARLSQSFSRWLVLGIPFVVVYELWWRGWDLKKACAHVGLFLRLGVPGMLMITMEWSAYELLTLMAGVLPNAVVAVSAHAVQVNVNNLLYMVFAGLAVAANIRVGNCLGANSPKQARLACMVALTLSLGISLMIAVTLFTMRGNIPKLFLGDRESIEQAASVLAVWAPLELLDGQNTVLLGVFRGAGEQKVAATVNAVAYYVFGIPTAAVLGFYFVLGVEGLWLGFGFGIFISAALLYYMMLRCWSWETVADNAQKRTEE
ncbi:hypothetical protein BBJ29_000518 [Phytophthora kernoviae]|uniref:Polysaccharide biosynthesis protein C-terminal domain-containing protein n=1 Tax=Phytophthora kernoviae TaxID=325452 RepID=A0A3F2RYD9_9STRA|nr:hypothetical protein BBJ29_000518 [Phytophthora kernoviae]RLN66659.1 hypothetical protein BBP00_00002088 [Phytophthora kernoviae]